MRLQPTASLTPVWRLGVCVRVRVRVVVAQAPEARLTSRFLKRPACARMTLSALRSSFAGAFLPLACAMLLDRI